MYGLCRRFFAFRILCQALPIVFGIAIILAGVCPASSMQVEHFASNHVHANAMSDHAIPAGTWLGTPLLYDGSPELVGENTGRPVSLLSLFISVPTIAVFLVIMSSLEAHARACGAGGLFGWLRMLPWQVPAMTAIGMAVVNLALGGIFAFVLIRERLAPLLSDTLFVPAYFHFLTIGIVTLTLLAAFT